jgi:hypothetical protein
MGLTCSHTNFEVSNINPTVYTDKTNTWNYIVADAECKNCKTKLRSIKKTCIDHNIPQPWEIVDKVVCKHDIITIYNKIRDIKNNRYNGRAECVACLVNIPVYITFKVEKINGNYEDIQTSEWQVDKIKHNQEKNLLLSKKNNTT